MSGPKTSSVRLDPATAKRLKEEREKKSKIIFNIKNKEKIFKNLGIIAIDYDIHKILTQKLKKIKEKFYKNLTNLSNKAILNKKIEELEKINRDFEKIFNEFKECYITIFESIVDNVNKVSKILTLAKKNEIIFLIDKISAEKKEETKSIIIDIKNITDRILKSNNQNTENIEKLEFQEIKLEKKNTNKVLDFSKFEKKKEDKEATLIQEIEEIVKEILEDLSNFIELGEYTINNRQLVLDMKVEVLNLKKENIDLDIKKALLLEKKENIENELKRIKFNNRKVENLYNDYLKEAYYFNLDIKPIREFSSKDEIESEIKILREKSKNNSEKAYIKKQLEEVMEKHGYNMIDSEYIEKSRGDNRLLYSVNDSTGIDIFISDTQEQKVTLKVVGVGFDEEISEREADRLYEEQCNFCSMFPELIEELKIRGVILDEVKYNEPNKKYNSKIKVKKSSVNRNNKKKSRENNDKKYREIGR